MKIFIDLITISVLRSALCRKINVEKQDSRKSYNNYFHCFLSLIFFKIHRSFVISGCAIIWPDRQTLRDKKKKKMSMKGRTKKKKKRKRGNEG